MSLRQRKLARAVKTLSKYFAIHSVKETAELAVNNDIDSLRLRDPSANRLGAIGTSTATAAEITLIDLIINTSEGAYTTKDFYTQFTNLFENLSANEKNLAETSFKDLIQVFYEKSYNILLLSDDIELGPSGDKVKAVDVGIRKMLGHGDPGTDQNFVINQNPSRPTKEFPGLSIYVSNSPRVTIETQNTAASTIFLNGVPNVELMRATPYLNVEFFFPRPPLSTVGKQLQNLSLNKFLLGAESPGENSVTEFMAKADTIAGAEISSRAGTPDSPIPETYSVSGMELFTSPQTLVNANDVSIAARSNTVLDKFRPLMTLQDFEVKIAPSRGLISYKNGSLSFVLHDRSRLAEVAEFVRADLYGTNEITIEYGWSHPDGLLHNTNNPYGDLIDGLRIKEKYMVTNSSFTFDPSGQVNIKLAIAMRGAAEFDTEIMSSEAGGLGGTLRDIRELQNEIAELRQRAFPNTSITTSTEIRGHQILNAAQDAVGNVILTSELRTALTRFKNAYTNSTNPSARELARKLQDLFGTQKSNNRQRREGRTTGLDGEPTSFSRLRSTIQANIANKISVLQDGFDPFLLNVDTNNGDRHVDSGISGHGQTERAAGVTFRNHAFNSGITNNTPISLARLLLLFVGQPIANTKNYDEVQMFFYPFNGYAGKASKMNIANFVVSSKYFADELARYRLEHISRSSVMSLSQFMNFLADILLDDPAAPSYGLFDDGGNMFREKYTDPEGRVRPTTVPVDGPAEFQQRMENVLRGVTPDGTFKPPQLGIHIETLPSKIGISEGENTDRISEKSILRLHIYDKVSTAYEPIGRILLASQRDDVRSIGTIAAFPPASSGNPGVATARSEIANSVISSAESIGLIERIPTASSAGTSGDISSTGVTAENSDVIYRITGGPKKMKEFIMLNSPYIIFGAGGTTIKSAQLNSMQNSSLATVNILRSFRREEGVTPSGENVGGLPMNVIPSVMNMECVGNPLLNYMQSFFLDFQTGTTVDNMYAITSVNHKFTQGDFTTSVKFTPIDAWGSYRSLVSTIGSSLNILAEANQQEDNEGNTENNPGGN